MAIALMHDPASQDVPGTACCEQANQTDLLLVVPQCSGFAGGINQH